MRWIMVFVAIAACGAPVVSAPREDRDAELARFRARVPCAVAEHEEPDLAMLPVDARTLRVARPIAALIEGENAALTVDGEVIGIDWQAPSDFGDQFVCVFPRAGPPIDRRPLAAAIHAQRWSALTIALRGACGRDLHGTRRCVGAPLEPPRRETGCELIDGEVWCRGRSSHGEAGPGTEHCHASSDVDVCQAPSARIALPERAVQLALAAMTSCALLESGEVWCWGAVPGAPLRASRQCWGAPQRVLTRASAIAAGSALHVCVLDSSHTRVACLRRGHVWSLTMIVE